MQTRLHQLDNTLKHFLFIYVLVLTTGISVGLAYLNQTTKMSSEGAIDRWRGSDTELLNEFEIPEQYPKSAEDMLMTTHNHIIGFSFIFLSIGIIFYFNSVIEGFWKGFLMIEPLVSTLITFSSIWAVRFWGSGFIVVTIISAILMYGSFFVMAGVISYELMIKKS